MNKHSFSVELATVYGIEKAILLDNFYYWCTKNAANDKNIIDGRAYTYNTAEALAVLFPYIKPRKIAELLRQLEADGLLISAQPHGTNRVKSYALTDKALEFYTSVYEVVNNTNFVHAAGLDAAKKNDAENMSNLQKLVPSNIQKLDNGTYRKATMERTEKQQCSITNNKQQILTTDKGKKSKMEIPTISDITEYCKAKGYDIDVKAFYYHYNDRNWCDKNGKKLASWRHACYTWYSNQKRWENGGQAKKNIYGRENDCAGRYAELI